MFRMCDFFCEIKKGVIKLNEYGDIVTKYFRLISWIIEFSLKSRYNGNSI